MLKVFPGLRSRMLMLIAIPFVVMLGMLIYHQHAENEGQLANARTRVLDIARAMAGEHRRISAHAQQVLSLVVQFPEVRRGVASEECNRALATQLREEPGLNNILLALANGDVICNAIPTTQRISIAERDFFKTAIRTRQFSAGGYVISHTTGKAGLAFGYPVLDAAGVPQGVVSTTVGLTWLNQELTKAQLPEGARAVVVDGQGIVVARHPDPEGWVGKSAVETPLLKSILAKGGEGAEENIGLDGLPRILGFVPLYRTASGQAYLWIAIPKDVVVGATERANVLTLLIQLLLIIATFGAVWMGSDRLFGQRITALTRAAEDMGKGNLDVRTGFKADDDEIGHLAQSFDRMAEEIGMKDRRLRSASRYARSLIEASLDPLVTISPEGKITDVNESTVKVTGMPRDKLVGTDFSNYFTEPQQARSGYREAFEKGFVTDYPLTIRHQDGRLTEVLYNASVYRNETGEVQGVFAAARDITERKHAEERTKSLDRLLRSIRDVNRQIVREHDLNRLLKGACDTLTQVTGYHMAWIGLVQEGSKRVLPAARSGRDTDYLDTITITWDEQPTGLGPTGTAIRTGRSSVMRDIENDPRYAPWREAARSRGYQSSIALPILIGGRAVGALNVYADSTNAFDDDEIALLTEVADDVGYAIRAIDADHARKIAEEDLRASSRYARSLIEASLDPLVTISPEGMITDVNEATVKATGMPREKLVGTDFSNYFTEPNKAREGYRQVFAQGYITDYPLTIRRRDGHLADVLYNASIYKDAQGNVMGVFAAARDITERMRMERVLREKEERLALATLHNCIGIWDWNLQTQEMIWDDSMYALYHIRREDFSGTEEAWRASLHPDDLARGDREVEDAISGVKPFDTVFRVVWPNGEIHYIKAAAKVFRDDQGTPLRMLGTNMDITDLKHAENKINELNRDLEQRVRDRTAQLEAANHELEAFAYSVSHDLRAPLRSIDGFSKALLEDYAERLDDEGKDDLRRVRAASQRMGQLIDDLLKLSRLSRSEMTVETVDLSALARSVAEELKVTDPGRRVVIDIAPRIKARGDKRLLAVVLENLLGNAWKFTGKHATARIEFGVMEKDGEPVYFVRDDGAGFDMAHVANLYAPFQRLHSVVDFPGTGIGLATVRRIVQRHGGRVWAEGVVGQGATFYFTLSTAGIETNPEERAAALA